MLYRSKFFCLFKSAVIENPCLKFKYISKNEIISNDAKNHSSLINLCNNPLLSFSKISLIYYSFNICMIK